MDSKCTVTATFYSEHSASELYSTPCVFYAVGSVLVCRQPKCVKQKVRSVILTSGVRGH
jgi:hypothetical protein